MRYTHIAEIVKKIRGNSRIGTMGKPRMVVWVFFVNI